LLPLVLCVAVCVGSGGGTTSVTGGGSGVDLIVAAVAVADDVDACEKRPFTLRAKRA
jgi:hypothetical protein